MNNWIRRLTRRPLQQENIIEKEIEIETGMSNAINNAIHIASSRGIEGTAKDMERAGQALVNQIRIIRGKEFQEERIKIIVDQLIQRAKTEIIQLIRENSLTEKEHEEFHKLFSEVSRLTDELERYVNNIRNNEHDMPPPHAELHTRREMHQLVKEDLEPILRKMREILNKKANTEKAMEKLSSMIDDVLKQIKE